jgi:hypothetical protein
MNKKIFISIITILLSINVSASKLKKGYQALEIFNYFKAKELFEKSQKRHPVAANYGLSIIYQRNDNPFTNIDSSLSKIVYSCNNYSALKEKFKIKYKKFGVDSVRLFHQRDIISELYYQRALEVQSIYGFQDFIDKNEWSNNVKNAIYYRDSLYYEEMNKLGRSQDYANFISTYPNSIFNEKAQRNFEIKQYQESTKDNNLISYIQFVNEFPESPFREQAEDEVYKLSTSTKTKEAYANFIKDYPKNRNVNQAWQFLYESTLQTSYSESGMRQFLNDYPNFPFKTKVLNELKLENLTFLKVKENSLWGFVSEDGSYKIDCQFDYVESFNEGLAVVSLNGMVGYISKTGEMKIEPKFDDGFNFINGAAVIEKDDKMGLINRNGAFILEPVYEDVGNMSSGLSYFETEKGYGYSDNLGFVRLKDLYTSASDFENGKAIVSMNNNYGVIDVFGTTYLPFVFKDIKMIDSSLYALKRNGKWGIMNVNRDTILSFEFDFIGDVSENILIVSKNDDLNYFNLKSKLIISNNWFTSYPEFKILGQFVNGKAKVKTEKGYNFINNRGEFVFTKPKSNLGFYNTYIAYEKDGKWGYLDSTSKIIIKPMYNKTYSFGKVGGVIEKLPLRGIVDVNNKELIGVFYEDFYFINDSILIAKSNGYYGLINIQGDTIISLNKKIIEPYSKSIVSVITNDSVQYYNVELNKWIRKEN